MLAEAIEAIALLWNGGFHSFDGKHVTVEDARIYTLPSQPPPMHVAVSGPASIGLAAQHGTGMIAVQPDAELVRAFDDATGGERPKIGQVVVCVGDDEAACGPDPDVHAAAIRQWVDAGFTHVAIAQVGPDQEAFLRMWETELAPRLV